MSTVAHDIFLAPHFTLGELIASETAARKRIDNSPSDLVIENLRHLAATLERVRELTKRPIVVSSGYRSPALNKAVGGSATSAHMRGLAADINCYPHTPYELGRMIVQAGIPFDQLIQEGTWLHIGVAEKGKVGRGQLLTAVFTTDWMGRKKTTYKAGWFKK